MKRYFVVMVVRVNILFSSNKMVNTQYYSRVTTAQGKQGIWFLLFPDRENTGNFVLTQGKIF